MLVWFEEWESDSGIKNILFCTRNPSLKNLRKVREEQ